MSDRAKTLAVLVIVIGIMMVLSNYHYNESENILNCSDTLSPDNSSRHQSDLSNDIITKYVPKNATIISASCDVIPMIDLIWTRLPNGIHRIASDGDVNGDGHPDLVGIFLPNVTTEPPQVHTFFGPFNRTLPVPVQRFNMTTERTVGITNLQNGDDFECNLHIDGDINGDGRSDLIVSSNRNDTDGVKNAGSVYVYFGRSNGFNTTPDIEITATDFLSEFDASNAHMGIYLDYAGDLNNDGFDDVVFCREWPRVDNEEIYLIYGRPDTENITVTEFSLDHTMGFPLSGLGDLNRDGYDDIGTYGDDGGRYELIVLYGSDAGLRHSNRTIILNLVSAGRVTSGDLDGDGWLDLVFCSPDAEAPWNDIGIIYGPIVNTTAGPDSYIRSGVDEMYGYARAVVDINNDGYAELLLSYPMDTGNDISHPLAVIQAERAMVSFDPIFTSSPPSGFGEDSIVTRIAACGDLDGNGEGDLWVQVDGHLPLKTSVWTCQPTSPYNATVSLNGEVVRSWPDLLEYPKHLDLMSDLQALLSNATPQSNGTVKIIISTSSENAAQPLLENLTIEYLLVEPPNVFSVEPLPEGNALRISWKGNGDDATHYHLVSNASGTWEVLREFAAGDGQFNHMGLVDGDTYYYRFIADNREWSISTPMGRILEGTPMDILPPDPPGGLTVTAQPQGNTLEIYWDAIGGDCLGYTILLWNGTQWDNIITVPNSTIRYIHTGLVDGIPYWYSIVAFDEVPNLSEPAPWVTGTPQDIIPPDIPSNLSVEAMPEGNALRLVWDKVEDDVTGYTIHSLVNGTWTEIARVNVTETVIGNLTNGEEYIFTVTSRDEVPNNSTHSESVSGTPIDTLPPTAPGNLRAGPGTEHGSINLTWELTFDDTVTWVLERMVDGGDWEEIARFDATRIPRYTDTDLTTDTAHKYRIYSIDDDDLTSEASSEVSAEPLDTVAPPPVILDALPVFTRDETVQVSGTAEAFATVTILMDSQVSSIIEAGADGRFSEGIRLAEGFHRVEAFATDRSGNAGMVSVEQSVTLDTTPPHVVKYEPDLSVPLTPLKMISVHFDEQLMEERVVVELTVGNIPRDLVFEFSQGEEGTVLTILLDEIIRKGTFDLQVTGTDLAGNEFVTYSDGVLKAEEETGSNTVYYAVLLVVVFVAVALMIWKMRPRED